MLEFLKFYTHDFKTFFMVSFLFIWIGTIVKDFRLIEINNYKGEK